MRRKKRREDKKKDGKVERGSKKEGGINTDERKGTRERKRR